MTMLSPHGRCRSWLDRELQILTSILGRLNSVVERGSPGKVWPAGDGADTVATCMIAKVPTHNTKMGTTIKGPPVKSPMY